MSSSLVRFPCSFEPLAWARLEAGTYTTKVRCSDFAGNETAKDVLVLVPHDSRSPHTAWIGLTHFSSIRLGPQVDLEGFAPLRDMRRLHFPLVITPAAVVRAVDAPS